MFLSHFSSLTIGT